jgi:hypothetical protein
MIGSLPSPEVMDNIGQHLRRQLQNFRECV